MNGLLMKLSFIKPEEKISDLNDEVKRHGDNFTRKITKGIKQESLSWIAIELAWTAGVTVILGLYLAYYIGYGTTPSTAVIFYFGTYTAVAIIMALAVRLVRNAKSEEADRDRQRLLLRCNNHVFHLMRQSRNELMADMDPEKRRIYAAYIVLKDPEASSDDLSVVVKDLTADYKLSEAVKRIETFRYHGMTARIQDEYEQVKTSLNKHVTRISKVAPQTASMLKKRFSGIVPTMQEGHERPFGFLERAINAAEHNDLTLLAFEDVHEIFSFAFEMLNGREIAVLHPEFNGHADYVEAQDKLDRSRSLLRQAVAKRNSRLKALSEILSKATASEMMTPVKFNANEIVDIIDEDYKNLRSLINAALKAGDKKALRAYHKALKNSFKIKNKVLHHHKRALRFMSVFTSIRKSYDKIWKKHGKNIKLLLEDDKNSKSHLTIREDYINLDNDQNTLLVKKLILLHTYLLKEQTKHYEKFTSIELSSNGYKRLALEYVLIMDEIMNFSQPEELFAIEYSNAPCFGHIDINSPTRTKVGLALLSIEELQQTRQKVAHRLARNLREYYRVPLNTHTIKYLATNFGADKEYLANLNNTKLNDNAIIEERYVMDLSLKDWEKSFAPLIKKIHLATKNR
tara:strand:+ start:78507 stop:80393 length:1887 start_codon:yes stop_codon:yes gene_type:complete